MDYHRGDDDDSLTQRAIEVSFMKKILYRERWEVTKDSRNSHSCELHNL